MHNAVMCTFSLYDVIGITGHLHIKFKSFSNIAQPLHKEAVSGCSFLYIIAKKSVIMSEAILVLLVYVNCAVSCLSSFFLDWVACLETHATLYLLKETFIPVYLDEQADLHLALSHTQRKVYPQRSTYWIGSVLNLG